jgi:hypothetical protein
MPATRRIRSVPAIDVPPNFITMRATGAQAPSITGLRSLGQVD